MSEVYHHTINHDDVIVMGSDGVFDNMFNEDILSCLEGSFQDVQASATCLADRSLFMSKDEKFDSPWAIGYRKARGKKDYLGGKEDDITVVVSKVNLNK